MPAHDTTTSCLTCNKLFSPKSNSSGKYCSATCYHISMQGERISLADRFWSRVCKTDTCWIWVGCRKPFGYGSLRFKNKSMTAHRISWELHNGPIPEGAHVLHRCDQPSCVRPDHLWLGSNSDNMRDMAEKGRAATGEKHGSRTHPETRPRGEQVKGVRLTAEIVVEIREKFSTGKYTKTFLARQYGVAETTMAKVIHRNSWKHIP